MLNFKVRRQNGTWNDSTEPCHTNLKYFRAAYLTEISEKQQQPGQYRPIRDPKLTISDNKLSLRKYYPKKLVSAFIKSTNELSDNLRTSAKSLKSLKVGSLHKISVSLRSVKSLEILVPSEGNRNSWNRYWYPPQEFKRMLMLYKRIERLKIRAFLRDNSWLDLQCLTMLKSLDLGHVDNYFYATLPAITKVVPSLNALESISMIMFVNPPYYCPDPMNSFLSFCERLLAKNNLRAFSLVLSRSKDRFSAESLERLFQLLERSKIEKWNIQTTLAEDQVVGMAEKYRIFRQSEYLAFHLSETSNLGLASKHLLKAGPFERTLNLYLQESSSTNNLNYTFDLEAVTKHCTNLKYLYLSSRTNPLRYPLTHDDFKEYTSLRVMDINIHLSQNNWQHLLKILKNSPCLERFCLYTEKNSYSSMLNPDTEIDLLRSCLTTLSKIPTLKSVKFKIFGLSQGAMDVLENLFITLKGLKELKLRLFYSQNRVSIVPKIPLDQLSQLTEIRLWLPYSPETHLENLYHAIPKLSALRVIKFKSEGTAYVQWNRIEVFLKRMRRLPGLVKFSFLSRIEFDQQGTGDEDIERNSKTIKEEIVSLVSQCRTLEFVRMIYVGHMLIEYNKEM